MPKKSGKRYGPTLTEWTETYIREHDLSEKYEYLLRRRVKLFNKWAGRDLPVAELTCDLVNKWLDDLRRSGLKPTSIAGYRRNLRSVWMEAYMQKLCDDPPFRLKRIRAPLPSPQAYTLDEIRLLVGAAKALKGFAPNGVRWCDLWTGLILSAYSTGLRRGDLLAIERSQIADDGLASVIQHKTGFVVIVRFSAEAMECIRRMNADDGRALSWPYHANIFSNHWRRLRKDSGVNRGQFRWLRRSAASYAEKQMPGLGSRMLGHRDPRLVTRHYCDPVIAAADPVALPAVG